MSHLSGYLLASTAHSELSIDYFENGGTHRAPNLVRIGSRFELKQWDAMRLTSPIALADEVDTPPGALFHYNVALIRGFSKAVLLADRRRIAEYAINQVIEQLPAPRLRRVPVLIDELIRFAQTSESEFLVTSLIGRYAGPGRQLRIMSLYGDDVTDSAAFRDQRDLFNFFSCGLGRRLYDGLPRIRPNEEGEILRIGNDGFLSANIGDRHRAQEFMRVVSFIVQHRWLEEWVPISAEERLGQHESP